MESTVFDTINGYGSSKKEYRIPHTIPIIIGFFKISLHVFFTSSKSKECIPGLKKDYTVTAEILYKGTLPIIINGPIMESP